MNGKVYNVLKFIAQVALPAATALFVALASIWNWPYKEAIAGTLAAIDTFLGAILMIDSNNYFKNKKIIDVNKDEGEGND